MVGDVVVVRAPTETGSRQGLPQFVGVGEATAGAAGLSMYLVVVPPGASSEPHLHRGFETAIYQLSGEVETRYGPGLARSVVTRTGDFLFIPPDVPHQAVNLSATEPASAVVARNDPREQESVVPYEAESN
jgi:uncharacterized RmlC-like cupin family protein